LLYFVNHQRKKNGEYKSQYQIYRTHGYRVPQNPEEPFFLKQKLEIIQAYPELLSEAWPVILERHGPTPKRDIVEYNNIRHNGNYHKE